MVLTAKGTIHSSSGGGGVSATHCVCVICTRNQHPTNNLVSQPQALYKNEPCQFAVSMQEGHGSGDIHVQEA